MITEADPGGCGLKPRNADSLKLKDARDFFSRDSAAAVDTPTC